MLCRCKRGIFYITFLFYLIIINIIYNKSSKYLYLQSNYQNKRSYIVILEEYILN